MSENTNSLIPSADAQVGHVRTLEMISAEIHTFTASMLNNIIEIGRRLCEAKEMLPYGQFGDWIKANTDFSRSQANNFMRLFQEYGARQGSLFGATLENEQAFGKLTYTKALALLDVPAEEREAFVADHDVDSMSTRELQEAIRERDEAKKALQEAREELAETSEMLDKTLDERNARGIIIREHEESLAAMEKELAELKARPTEAEIDQEAIDKAVAEAVEKAQADHTAILEKVKADAEEKRKALEKKVAAAEKKASTATEKLNKAEHDARVFSDSEGAKAEAQAAAEEVAHAKAEAAQAKAEAENLRRELAMSGEVTVTFKLYFAAWQRAYANMMDALAKADEETAGRLKAAIKAQMKGWDNG